MPEQTSNENIPQPAVTVKSLSGFDDGQELISEGQVFIIKGDLDEQGNVVGWHKEAKVVDGGAV